MSKTHARRAPNQLSPEREQALLDTALEVFVERGLGGATTDRIVARARISKTTLYRRYRNKEALFEAVIRREAEILRRDLLDFELDAQAPAMSLRAAASTLRLSASSPRHTEIRRLMVAEAARQPELVKEARDTLYSAVADRLHPFLETLMETGRMRRVDTVRAVSLFGLVFSGGLRPLLGTSMDLEAEAELFEEDLALFLRGWGIE